MPEPARRHHCDRLRRVGRRSRLYSKEMPMPTPRMDATHVPFAPHPLIPPATALTTLLDAYDGANALEQDRWQFAIEIRCLREAGLSHTHLRWLLANKLIEQ